MPINDLILRGKTGLASTISKGCGCRVVDTTTSGGFVLAVVDNLSAADNRRIVIAGADITAGVNANGFLLTSGVVLVKAGANGSKGDTLAIKDTQGRWGAATASDDFVPLRAVTDYTTGSLFPAVPFINLPAVSGVQTGDGTEQSIAHPLLVAPRRVLAIPAGTSGALGTSDFGFTYGAHTASVIKVTATNKLKYVVYAWE